MPIVTLSSERPQPTDERFRARLAPRRERTDDAPLDSGHGTRLWIRARGQVQVVDIDDIDWIESDLRYCWLHLRGGERRRIRESIGHLEKRLDPRRFARVHRSAIVPVDRISEVISSAREHAIVLKNGTRIPMSRSGRRRLLGSTSAPR